MKQAVKDVFVDFSTRLEGCVPWMYLDVKGLVTVAIGCLVDPAPEACKLPFVDRKTGQKASVQQILTSWQALKNQQWLKTRHYNQARGYTTVDLSPEGVLQVVWSRALVFEDYIRSHFLPEYDEFPSDAQLAILSMAWACGPGFPKIFKNWLICAQKQDWAGCAKTCAINTKNNAGIIPRNKANIALFQAAAKSEDPDKITGWA
jgi:GH24 family phage-related lysozyme (muramidase)